MQQDERSPRVSSHAAFPSTQQTAGDSPAQRDYNSNPENQADYSQSKQRFCNSAASTIPAQATCIYCGHGTPVIQSSVQADVVIPGRVMFDDCPRCRDRFAMAALTGILASGASMEARHARKVYEMADAMIAARKPKP